MKSGEEIVLNYCDSIKTHDIEHLQSCLDNAKDIRAKNYQRYEMSGCPSNFDLDEWEGLCFEEEVKGLKAQSKQCKACWVQALGSEFKNK